MQVLLYWDDQDEAELLTQFLSAAGHQVITVLTVADLERVVTAVPTCGCVLMTVTAPDSESAFDLFCHLRVALPDCPIVGACPSQDVYRIARFLTNGMQSYLVRDQDQGFVFLAAALLEEAVERSRLERESLDAEKLKQEFEAVTELQRHELLESLDAPLGTSLAARHEPARAVASQSPSRILGGGDWYHLARPDARTLVMFIGDASRHGRKACLSILALDTLMHLLPNGEYRRTDLLVDRINERLMRQLNRQPELQEEDGLITFLAAVFDARWGELRWTSAGHPAPLLLDRNTGSGRVLDQTGAEDIPLALVDDVEFGMHVTQIPVHSRLFLYTDGLEEVYPSANLDQAPFGTQGVLDSLQTGSARAAHLAIDAVFDASQAHAAGHGWLDDATAICIDRLEP